MKIILINVYCPYCRNVHSDLLYSPLHAGIIHYSHAAVCPKSGSVLLLRVQPNEERMYFQYPGLLEAAPAIGRVGYLALHPSEFDVSGDTNAVWTGAGYLASVTTPGDVEAQSFEDEPMTAQEFHDACLAFEASAESGNVTAQRLGDGRLRKVFAELAGKVLTSEAFQALLAKLLAGALG